MITQFKAVTKNPMIKKVKFHLKIMQIQIELTEIQVILENYQRETNLATLIANHLITSRTRILNAINSKKIVK